MLRRLSVRDLVVAPLIEVEFSPGLTVITGESGAGKSVLLDALGLALGARASADRIRPGADRAEAQAELAIVAGSEGERFLAEQELLDSDAPDICRLRRTVDRNGRSRAFINDRAVTSGALARLGATVVDIHAQGENTRLLRSEVQLGLLDDHALKPGMRASLAARWKEWRRAIADIEEIESEGSVGEDRLALLGYQHEELIELAAQPGEFPEIDGEHRRLSRLEELRAVVARGLAAMETSEALRIAAGELAALVDDDASLGSARESLDTALSLIDDAGADLRRYADRLEPDDERMRFLDERLRRMHDIARKHRVTPEELPDLAARISDQIERHGAREERLAAAREECRAREAAYRKEAGQVSALRRKAEGEFAGGIAERMRSLGIDGGTFVVEFHDAETEQGLETVTFRISTHPDHRPAPLGRVASGGERARISLAISLVAAERSALPCLVLDEADIGVGGMTADAVGRALRQLSERAQVICVTHAPQIAALGDRHLRVSRGAGAATDVTLLGKEERVEELARMVSGAGITDRARAHAKGLMAAGAGRSES